MEPDQAQAQIREFEQTIAHLTVDKQILQTYVDEWTHRFQIMQSSRNRWRLCAMELADTLYKRLPNLPDLEAFYSLLHDPLDGDGL